MKMISLMCRHVYIENSRSFEYIAHSFATCQMSLLNTIASYK